MASGYLRFLPSEGCVFGGWVFACLCVLLWRFFCLCVLLWWFFCLFFVGLLVGWGFFKCFDSLLQGRKEDAQKL